MRFVFSAVSVSFLSSVVSAESCSTYCESVKECSEDPHAHWSYCMTWNYPKVCSGMFWRDAEKKSMCFLPNDPSCPAQLPVACPEEPTETPVVSTETPVETTPSPVGDNCQAFCENTLSCKNDPKYRGTWCKIENTPSTCHSLFWTSEAKTATCYYPVDGEACPVLYPVLCSDELPVAPTPVVAKAVTAAAEPAVVVETTVAPATEAPATEAPATEAPATEAPATAAPIAQPSGRFAGEAMKGAIKLEATLDPSAMRLTVMMTMGQDEEAVQFIGSNVPYTFDGSRVHLVDGPEAQAFLAKLPMKLTADKITITYNAAEDSVSCSFPLGRGRSLKIDGKKTA